VGPWFPVAPGLDDELLAAMRKSSGWEPKVGVQYVLDRDGNPAEVPKSRTSPVKNRGEGSWRNEEERLTQAEAEREREGRSEGEGGEDEGEGLREMASNGGAGDGGGMGSIDTAVFAPLDEWGDEEAMSGGGGRSAGTRNDNPNALNGVEPYYAMPQEVLPVFFEPTPTQAMIAARKSFLNRQGRARSSMPCHCVADSWLWS